MPLVGSGLSSTGSRGASAFSVCSAPGVEVWGHPGLDWHPLSRGRSALLDQTPGSGYGPGGGGSTSKPGLLEPLLWL